MFGGGKSECNPGGSGIDICQKHGHRDFCMEGCSLCCQKTGWLHKEPCVRVLDLYLLWLL